MRIEWIIWKGQFIEKLRSKHGVSTMEVAEVLRSGAHFRKAERGHVQGEDVFAGYGRTDAGRYLVVFFILKRQNEALVISSRDMTHSERRYYEKVKKG